MDQNNINPIYKSYALTHGETPEAMMANDEVKWPGGVLCGFILWIQQAKDYFCTISPESFLSKHTIYDYQKWYDFVNNEYTEKLKC